jgi:hypothetical protein
MYLITMKGVFVSNVYSSIVVVSHQTPLIFGSTTKVPLELIALLNFHYYCVPVGLV